MHMYMRRRNGGLATVGVYCLLLSSACAATAEQSAPRSNADETREAREDRGHDGVIRDTDRDLNLPEVLSGLSCATSSVVTAFCALLNRTMRHKNAWPFSEPVDPVALGLPDYFSVVKRPIDLRTIRDQLVADKRRDGGMVHYVGLNRDTHDSSTTPVH